LVGSDEEGVKFLLDLSYNQFIPPANIDKASELQACPPTHTACGQPMRVLPYDQSLPRHLLKHVYLRFFRQALRKQ
jgi:hypothetical protein